MKNGKSRTISFRVSAGDYERLAELAGSQGLPSVNQLAQASLLKRLDEAMSALPNQEREDLEKTLLELREALRILRERLGVEKGNSKFIR